MATFKKIKRYYKIKKLIIFLTVILVILDTIIAFADPAYLMSSSSLMGFSLYYIFLNIVNMSGVLT